MTLSQNTIPQLWRKAEADTRDAVNLFLSPSTESESVEKILAKLDSASKAMKELQHRMTASRYKGMSPNQVLDARLDEIEEGHHPKCECPRCKA